jgi:ubiquitin C-terminal hydrolase
MTTIKPIFHNYFHLIRHPKEAVRKRDKLLTAIAILSCIAVIVPAAMGIGYALAGRVKRGVVPPVGFRNFGQVCWFTAGVQALLASRHFREIIKEPLVRWTNQDVFDVDENGYRRLGWIVRDETDEEFEARKALQEAFVEFFDVAEANDAQEMNRSIRQLHERLYEIVGSQKLIRGRNLDFAKIGTPSDTRLFYDLLEYLECANKVIPVNFDAKLQGEIEKFLSQYEKAPNMLLIPTANKKKELDLDFTLNLSDKFDHAVYRLVGVKQYVPGHAIATVLKEGQWFVCDDSRVSQHHSDSVRAGQGDWLILDLVLSD